jgi:hypothetical protein
VTHKGNVYPGEHQAIIPRELWDKTHSILAKNHHARTAKTKAETPALLKGLIRCGHCQTSMGITFTRKAGKMYRYYLCLNASKTDYGVCPVKSVAAGDIERVVVDRRSLFHLAHGRRPDLAVLSRLRLGLALYTTGLTDGRGSTFRAGRRRF